MAETIFMIHGMWGGPWNFDNFKARFEAEGYRCVTPTLRFHDMDPRAVPDPRLGTTSLFDGRAARADAGRARSRQGARAADACLARRHHRAFAEAVYSMMHLVPAEEQKRAYERYVYESGRAACEIGYWMLDSRRASRVDAAAVKCPVLVVAGAEDRITPAAVVRQVAKKYEPVATYKEFARHAHWMMAEPGWEEAAEYAAQWLGKVFAK